jgi:hypothetical protein
MDELNPAIAKTESNGVGKCIFASRLATGHASAGLHQHFAFGGEKGCKIASSLSSIAFGCAQERAYCGGFCAPASAGDVPARRAQEGKEKAVRLAEAEAGAEVGVLGDAAARVPARRGTADAGRLLTYSGRVASAAPCSPTAGRWRGPLLTADSLPAAEIWRDRGRRRPPLASSALLLDGGAPPPTWRSGMLDPGRRGGA